MMWQDATQVTPQARRLGASIFFFLYAMGEWVIIDGYNTFLHELGHAGLLYHIIDITKIMYFQAVPGLLPPNRLIYLNKDYSAHDGGVYEVQLARDTAFLYLRGYKPIYLICPTHCTPYYGNDTKDIIEKDVLTIYPNPVSNLLTVHYVPSAPKDAVLKVYNAIGQIVYMVNIPTNNSDLIIPAMIWSSGLFILTIQSNSSILSTKIIKQ